MSSRNYRCACGHCRRKFALSPAQGKRLRTALALTGLCPYCRQKFEIDLLRSVKASPGVGGQGGWPWRGPVQEGPPPGPPGPAFDTPPFEPLPESPRRSPDRLFGPRAHGDGLCFPGPGEVAPLPLDLSGPAVTIPGQCGALERWWKGLSKKHQWTAVLTVLVVVAGILLVL